MLFPQKTYVISDRGFHLEKQLPYRDLLNGRWYLQIQSAGFTNLPAGVSGIAQIATPFLKAVNETAYGNYENAPLEAHIFNLKSDASRTCFVNFPAVKYLITDPLPIFSVDIITPALSPADKKNCNVTICCNFFKEL